MASRVLVRRELSDVHLLECDPQTGAAVNTWRGAVVLLFSGLAGSAGMLVWVLLLVPDWLESRKTLEPDGEALTSLFVLAEGAGIMLGAVFLAGRLTARWLTTPQEAEQIARSGRWRMIPLHFVTGILLISVRWLIGEKRGLWTIEHIGTSILGLLLIALAVYEAWVHWVPSWFAKTHRVR